MQPYRIPPTLQPHQMTTYQLAVPLATHWRRATCEEINCRRWRKGWRTQVDESTDLGQQQAHFIRNPTHYNAPRRGYVESRDGGITTFAFKPGNPCFKRDTHRIPLEREPLYIVRGGDWRGNPRREGRTHTHAANWVDDCATHLDRIAGRINRG